MFAFLGADQLTIRLFGAEQRSGAEGGRPKVSAGHDGYLLILIL